VACLVSAATGEPVGTAAEEAARLLESLGGWFDARTAPTAPTAPNDQDRPTDSDGPPAEAASEQARRHGPTCRACPMCRGVAYLQEAHPDVLTHLTGAAQHLVAALRSLADPTADGAGTSADAAGPAADAGRAGPSRAVRIDVQPDAEPRTRPDARHRAAAESRASSATEQEQAP
jgi:hypothetical protein